MAGIVRELHRRWRRVVCAVTRNGQGWFWTKAWQAGEQEADADFKAGYFKTYTNADQLLADLGHTATPKDEAI